VVQGAECPTPCKKGGGIIVRGGEMSMGNVRIPQGARGDVCMALLAAIPLLTPTAAVWLFA